MSRRIEANKDNSILTTKQQAKQLTMAEQLENASKGLKSVKK